MRRFWLLASLLLLTVRAGHAAGRSQFIREWLKDYPAHASGSGEVSPSFFGDLAAAAEAQTKEHITYDPGYFKLAYPGGDVPANLGVCTDVLVRAYRKLGIDLQVAVHEDMAKDFRAYPDLWRRASPDANIDHRRVPNLMMFFGRAGAALPISSRSEDYLPGDAVAWDLGGGVTHIGLVANEPGSGGRHKIVHNIGLGPQLEDALFNWKIIGHFRYGGPRALVIHPHPVMTARRLALTREYCRVHYGLDSSELKDPRIIIIHATEIDTLAGTFKAFEPETITPSRKYLNEHGNVNVGVHFVVDGNGDIHSLLPLDVIGRHAIGLNHVSIGIENVGFADRLTDAQLDADAALVKDLRKRFPSVLHVIGHYEYVDKTLPHYALFEEIDPEYAPTQKSDPGPNFMKSLRERLDH